MGLGDQKEIDVIVISLKNAARKAESHTETAALLTVADFMKKLANVEIALGFSNSSLDHLRLKLDLLFFKNEERAYMKNSIYASLESATDMLSRAGSILSEGDFGQLESLIGLLDSTRRPKTQETDETNGTS